ncbi:MAG TPA: glycosyltransferase, partial [Ruminococcus sp.]|nr:glycosyltransferase [Ruminococcus sp.]
MKIISFAVPCYNSQDYMKRCIESLLPGGEDVEIIIVDDGSSDGTYDIAEAYREKYPGIVRVIHKPNGGHGSAVNAGLKAAKGLYFKVVDSDDRLEEAAYLKILGLLKKYAGRKPALDLMISNFFYDNKDENKKTTMRYRTFLPKNRIYSWKDMRRPVKGSYILMHSVVFRTALLKKCGLKLPENTFYVDNLFVFKPLPYVRTMYYLDMDFYDYIIGRADQSV